MSKKPPRAPRAPYWRTRTKGFFSSTTARQRYWFRPLGGAEELQEENNPNYPSVRGSTTVMTDKVTPGAKQLMSQGVIINNGKSSVNENRTVDEQALYQLNWTSSNGNQQRYEVAGDVMTWCTVNTSTYPGHAALAASKIAARQIDLASIQAWGNVSPPQTQALVTLAELNKTIALIAETAEDLATLYRIARHGGTYQQAQRAIKRRFGVRVVFDRNGRPRFPPTNTETVKGPLQKWLEWRYGWGPMVSDVASSLQAIAKGEFNRPRYTARGFGNQTDQVSDTFSGCYAHGFFGPFDVTVTKEESVNVRAFVLYDADLQFQRVNDFGLLAFPETAWELLPFSFVADWFIPIGDWLRALSPKLGVNVLASGYSVKQTVKSVRQHTGYHGPNSGVDVWLNQTAILGLKDEQNIVTSWRSNSLPLPAFPPIKVQLNLKRAIDAIALVVANGSSSTRI